MTTEAPPLFLHPYIFQRNFTDMELASLDKPHIDVTYCIERAKNIARVTKTPEKGMLKALLAVSALRFFYENLDPITQKSLVCWYLNEIIPDSAYLLPTITSSVFEKSSMGDRSTLLEYDIQDEILVSQAIYAINKFDTRELRILFRLMRFNKTTQIYENSIIPNHFEFIKSYVKTSIKQGIPLEDLLERNNNLL